MTFRQHQVVCSFCQQSAEEVGGLVESPVGEELETPAHICQQCASQCITTLQKQNVGSEFKKLESVPEPIDLYNHLGLHVIGQLRAKKQLSVEVSNHYQRILNDQQSTEGTQTILDDPELQDVVVEKSNILLLGPTGCGKTLLAKSIAEKLQVPFAIGDATTLTEAGYVGEDVENLLLKLLIAADFDVEAAQRGIIFIDEIDKLRKTGGNVSITRDVSGEGVQQSLLKMIEGTIASVPPQGGRKHPEQQYIQLDTTNILFICGGAFVGLADIIRRRINKRRMGFTEQLNGIPDERQENNELLQQVSPEDLMEFGIIPELVGRLPIVTPLEELDEEALIRVLLEPKNSLIKQERKKFLQRGIKLEFTTEAVKEIAATAIKQGTGARALRSVVSKFMTDIHFDLPHDTPKGTVIKIDKETVQGAPFKLTEAA